MTIHVEAWARRDYTEHQDMITEGEFVFVAIDKSGQPRPVPEEQ